MSDDRGQALLAIVIALAVGAAAIVGLAATQDRLVTAARSQRAGEAAVEAASASLADAYVAHLAAVRARWRESPQPTPNVRGLLADPRTVDAARSTADQLARENGSGAVDVIEVRCVEGRVEARLEINGYAHRAGFAAPECFRP